MHIHKPFITSKLPNVGTTIFTTMSAMANELGAINLAQGFPDFDCDPRLLEYVHRALQAGYNQYAPMAGIMPLREALAQWVSKEYGANYDPATEITITSGATEALFCTLMALIRQGEEVIVLEPAYDAYLPVIHLCGGIAKTVPLSYPSYRIDWDRVRAQLSPKTKAILINTPHNPTGTAWTQTDIENLEELVVAHGLWVISDEVYEHIRYDGRVHHSITRYPALQQRGVYISSFGKSLHTTGWKVGYAMAPEPLTREIRKVHQFATFSTSTPFQFGLTEFLTRHPEAVWGLPAFYQEKRDLFLSLMQASSFKPIACEGTYFLLMEYGHLSSLSDKAFTEWLTREIGVAAIPISVFYEDQTDHKVIRFCFAKEEATLRAAAERLCAYAPT